MNMNDDMMAFYMAELIKEYNENPSIDPLHHYNFLRYVQIPAENIKTVQEQEESEKQIKFNRYFSFNDYEKYKQGDPSSILRAEKDKTKSFKNYYEPLMLLDIATRDESERVELYQNLADGRYKLLENKPYYVMVENTKNPNIRYILLRGTKNSFFTSVEDTIDSLKDLLYHDALNIAFKKNDNNILTSEIKTSFLNDLSNNKDKNFIIVGHSLGGSRADILHNLANKKNYNNVKSILFNPGQTMYNPFGYKIFGNPRQIIYRINNDPLSVPDARINERTNYIQMGNSEISPFFDIGEDLESGDIATSERIWDLLNWPGSIVQLKKKINPLELVIMINNNHLLSNFYSGQNFSLLLDEKIKEADKNINNLFLLKNKALYERIKRLKEKDKKDKINEIFKRLSLNQMKQVLRVVYGLSIKRINSLIKGAKKKAQSENSFIWETLDNTEKAALIRRKFREFYQRDILNF